MADQEAGRLKDVSAGAARRSACLTFAFSMLFVGAGSAVAQQAGSARDAGKQVMRIRIILDDRTVTATLADNPTARDFASLLPLALTLTDYAFIEKTSDLPRKLSEEGAPGCLRLPLN